MKEHFPAHDLRASSGEISAFVFENPNIHLARSIWWSVTLEFEPVNYGGADWTCSMTTDWIPWKIRNWRDLAGQHLHCRYGDDGIESSFYLVEHDYGTETELTISAGGGSDFLVSMAMTVEFSGYLGDDADPSMKVRAQSLVPFTSVIIPESLFPKPVTETDAETIASEFVDLSAFQRVERRHHGWLLRAN
jgi:hypothetical protein